MIATGIPCEQSCKRALPWSAPHTLSPLTPLPPLITDPDVSSVPVTSPTPSLSLSLLGGALEGFCSLFSPLFLPPPLFFSSYLLAAGGAPFVSPREREAKKMLRRSAWALAAAVGDNALSEVKGNSSALKVEGATPTHRVKVEIAKPPPADFVPPASEAPELLQAYVEPKPFISPRRAQLFAVSTAVGVTTTALLYFLLSKNISGNAEDEQALVDSVAAKNRLAAEKRQQLFPEFAAPSSYEQLQAKMAQRDREMARQEEQVCSATSTLNTEILFRLKMWWNRCLTNIQDAVDRVATALEQRRQSQVQANIEATLRYGGYSLVDLKRES